MENIIDEKLKKIMDYLLTIQTNFDDEKYVSEINFSLKNVETELESLIVRMERN